jgi:very-short-patch-repair endonuclease
VNAELLFNGVPFDWELARRHGLAPAQIRLLIDTGAVRQVLRGVYLDRRVQDDLGVRARCLRLRLPPGAAVSRVTAAWLYGVDGRTSEEQRAPLAVECTVPRGCEPVSRPGVQSCVAPLQPFDLIEVGGIPCTTPLRTCVDLLRCRRPHMGLAVGDALAARGLIDAARVRSEVERFRRGRGVKQARYLAGLIEPLTESAGESWLRLRLIDAGFPRPEAQIPVGGYWLDLGWRRHRVAIEYDGEEYHSSPAQRLHDERRREILERRFGWTVIGVGKGEVLGASLALERAVGELLGMQPKTIRRLW